MTKEGSFILILIGMAVLIALFTKGTSHALLLMAGCCFGFAFRGQIK